MTERMTDKTRYNDARKNTRNRGDDRKGNRNASSKHVRFSTIALYDRLTAVTSGRKFSKDSLERKPLVDCDARASQSHASMILAAVTVKFTIASAYHLSARRKNRSSMMRKFLKASRKSEPKSESS
jgi:hypothetical protein